MSNEWSNLSEEVRNRQKMIASVKLKKKTPIYKHVVIRKLPKIQPGVSEQELIKKKPDFPTKEAAEERSKSISIPNTHDEHYLSYPHNTIQQSSPKFLNNILKQVSQQLPSCLANSRINIGRPLNDSNKTKVLYLISKKALQVKDDDLKLKYYKNDFNKNFYVVCFGDHLSECCETQLVLQLSPELAGKVLCPHRNCVIQCLSNFIINRDYRETLWGENDLNAKKNVKKPEIKKDSDFRTYNGYLSGDLYCTDSITLTAPKDIFSVFIDPLQQVLKSHRKLKF
jgi:hypothetical protein